eukprot:365192-Chlamydomonas_euryale.AAC.11
MDRGRTKSHCKRLLQAAPTALHCLNSCPDQFDTFIHGCVQDLHVTVTLPSTYRHSFNNCPAQLDTFIRGQGRSDFLEHAVMCVR